MNSYRIEGRWPGQLAIIPRPRGGEWLEDEVRALKEDGFEIVVSLLTTQEARELGLTSEAELLRKHGLQFRNYPILDLGVPDSQQSARQFLETLRKDLLAGKKIAVHCRGSIGRSGLVASSVLVLNGLDPTIAFRQVSNSRGCESPETLEQKHWVANLSVEPVKSVA